MTHEQGHARECIVSLMRCLGLSLQLLLNIGIFVYAPVWLIGFTITLELN